MLDLALGALVATDAGAATGLAWYGTAASALILTAGLAVASSSAVHMSVALLAALLLLRLQDRLGLAPLYGAGLLLVGELAQRSLELRGQARIGPGVIGGRLTAVAVLAALGACSGAVVSISATIAPTRSVGLTAVGTIAVLATFATITIFARRHPETLSVGEQSGSGE